MKSLCSPLSESITPAPKAAQKSALPARRRALLVATALLTCHGAALARDQEAAAAQGLPPIDVTATPASAESDGKPLTGTAEQGYRQTLVNMGPLGERKILDLPFTVHTIPEALIANQDVQTFSELTKYIPSLQQQGHPGLEFGPPVIRGLAADDSSANTRIDGMNVRGDTQLPLTLYQSFEVLTGPSGALYGFSYPAGTLNGVLKRPTDAPALSATLGYVSALQPEFSIDFGGPVAQTNGVVGYRLNLLHSAGEAYVTGSDLKRDVLGLGVDVHLTPQTVVELNANRYRYEQDGFPAGFAYKGGSVKLPSALDPTKQGYGQSWSALIAQTDITDAKIIHHFNEDWSIEAGILRQEADRWFNSRLTNTLNGNGTYKATYSSSASFTNVVSDLLNINGVVCDRPAEARAGAGDQRFPHGRLFGDLVADLHAGRENSALRSAGLRDLHAELGRIEISRLDHHPAIAGAERHRPLQRAMVDAAGPERELARHRQLWLVQPARASERLCRDARRAR